ncbi:zinc-ribbon domain-containing protein [Rhodobacteraceae bacterium]|nr:zinc-ribbon domain-containing protein [Paracoccaceae bacterium]
MRFSCPCCGTDYSVPIVKMPLGYYKVVCSHCSYKWRKAIGVNTNFSRQRIDLEKDKSLASPSGGVKLSYRPEVLAILREEAATETRLRRS